MSKQFEGKNMSLAGKISNESYLNRVMFLVLIALFGIASLTIGNYFSTATALNLIANNWYIVILGIGVTFLLVSGHLDMSVGGIVGMAGVLSSYFTQPANEGFSDLGQGLGLPYGVAIVLTLAICLCIGLLNALFIAKMRVASIIVTLGTMSIARGIAYTVTGGYPIGSLPDSYKFLGLGYIAGIPTPIVLMVVLAALTIFFLNKTVVGRWIYAIGGNEEGARISGVRVNRVKRLVYSLSGLMAAISGIAMAARLGVGQSTAGQSYEMDAIAATVIGGASLSGGSGSIVGAIIGAAIMGVLRNGLVLLDVSAYWQQTVIGAVIILAVALDNLRHMKKKA